MSAAYGHLGQTHHMGSQPILPQQGGVHQQSPLSRPLNVYTANTQQPMLPQHYAILSQYNKPVHRGSAPGLFGNGTGNSGVSPRMYEVSHFNLHGQLHFQKPRLVECSIVQQNFILRVVIW